VSHVVATAGHVDHGKSSLVRALTGTDPDRWAEEKRRGLTIDLGFATMRLPSGTELSFVDVPGHERFVTNMLAGVGPAPAVVVVVAADEGWMPQTEEHVRAIAALGVRRGLLVVTKSDLADPGPVARDALSRLGFLDRPESVGCSAVTGAGLPDVVAALDRLAAGQPLPDEEAPVRFWLDRVFTISGAGTVVTGTLVAGTIRVGDRLATVPGDGDVVVRGIQSGGRSLDTARPTARVAVNLRGVDRDRLDRGTALLTPGAWHPAAAVDVCVRGDLPAGDLVAHLGSAAVPVRSRRLGEAAVRLRLARPLPLHVGDRLLLREPAGRAVVAADVADLDPPALQRRGDAGRVAARLTVPATADDLVDRRGTVAADALRATGLDTPTRARRVGRWWVAAATWDRWRAALPDLVAERCAGLSAGVPLAELRRLLDAPDDVVVAELAGADDRLHLAGGRVRPAAADVRVPAALDRLLEALAADPLAAPDADTAREIGADVLAHGARTGALLHLGGGIYVGPAAVPRAVERLAGLPQPFTVSAARAVLGQSRRVVVPLLEHLDAARVTRRTPDGTRFLVSRAG
jgi:selenocysteine-specific elongation factor